VKPVKIHPVTAPILIVFPTRVSPPPNVRIFSLLLKVFQSVSERNPLLDVVACVSVNIHVRLLYVSGHTAAERAVRPIFVATVDTSAERVPERVEMLPERVAIVPERAFCALVFVK
jgi:hypothetical protein